MNTDWYRGVNPNLDRLAQLLGMAGQKPSHGYTIAEKAPEVITAPGVYFPAEKGQVIPLESRQMGGNVSPSLPKDNERAKLEMLQSILSNVKPSNLESRQLGGSVIPPHGELERLKIEQSKYDILKSAISVLKPPKQSSDRKTSAKSSPSTEGTIPLESRQAGGNVSSSLLDEDENEIMDILRSAMSKKLSYNERTSTYGSPPGRSMFSNLPGIPKPPTAQSYGIQPDAMKVGTADKGISEGDLLWQRKRAEAGWANPAQDLWEHKREEAGTVPIFPRAEGGLVNPIDEDERRRKLLESMKTAIPNELLRGNAPPPPNIIDMAPNTTGTFEVSPQPFYSGPEGTMTVTPETPETIRGDELARIQLSSDIKKQEAERELLAKSRGYGQDMGYWVAHPEEKAQYDLEQMLSRYPQKERLELIKNLGKPTAKEPTPHLVQNEKGEYVWATPGEVLPAGIMGKMPQVKAPTTKSERTFNPVTGQTYEQDYEFVNGSYQPTGQRRMVAGPPPEKTQLTPGEKYEKGLKAIRDTFFQLDPIGNITDYVKGKDEKQYLNTLTLYEQNIKGGMSPIEAANDAITKAAPEKLVELPKTPTLKPKKEGRYNWEGHEWTWTKKEGWKLIK